MEIIIIIIIITVPRDYHYLLTERYIKKLLVEPIMQYTHAT